MLPSHPWFGFARTLELSPLASTGEYTVEWLTITDLPPRSSPLTGPKFVALNLKDLAARKFGNRPLLPARPLVLKNLDTIHTVVQWQLKLISWSGM